MRFEVVGGPFDGNEVVTGTRPEWGWVDGSRVWPKPGGRRVLHRLVPGAPRSTCSRVYLYAEHVWGACGGCGVVHRAADGVRLDETRCQMCGGRVARK